ncbi:hypothetical protein M408DRAFT_294822 [Serendipita vermifera MAFF 305830]|uniref:Uncharacterized protein n=1 Tax=Serendipita vermifera MAFF 305830 TaxID=933852 RepID=A0A0C3B089_SERVB|nr:hypothetical protein M408DRAFT_294822 [Serendipita vermifera MAFF 305830]
MYRDQSTGGLGEVVVVDIVIEVVGQAIPEAKSSPINESLVHFSPLASARMDCRFPHIINPDKNSFVSSTSPRGDYPGSFDKMGNGVRMPTVVGTTFGADEFPVLGHTTTPFTPAATVDRSAGNRPAPRDTRSFRDVSVDISPSTSGRDSPLVPRMTKSYQPFLPQGHFQPMSQHTPQMSPFGGIADGQMTSHGHNTQQQQPPSSAPPTLLQGQAQAQAHARHHHSHNNSSSQQQQQSLLAGNSSSINAGDLNPMAAYADQVCPPYGYRG